MAPITASVKSTHTVQTTSNHDDDKLILLPPSVIFPLRYMTTSANAIY